jgi:hypothetical protein
MGNSGVAISLITPKDSELEESLARSMPRRSADDGEGEAPYITTVAHHLLQFFKLFITALIFSSVYFFKLRGDLRDT